MTKIYAKFINKIVIVGCGSIGQGTLPLILRHIDVDKKNISIVTADERGREIAKKEGIAFYINPLTPKNLEKVLTPLLGEGGFLVNLSVDVSSVALMRYCQKHKALYIDTSVESWPDGYADSKIPISERANYGLRESAMKLKKEFKNGPTTIVCHGANPGIVSHFLKRALMTIAKDVGMKANKPANREEWAKLAKNLGVKTIHCAEYDTQTTNKPKQIGRCENTWSVDGLYGEAVCLPSELGWGTHEKQLPPDGRKYNFGCKSAIYLLRPGTEVKVRTWTPARKNFIGKVITHNESISIADYFTLKKGNKVLYRPTVHYAYRLCDAAMLSLDEIIGKNYRIGEQRILMDEIVDGMDELGMLIMGHKKNAYWYGSQLTIQQARKLAPYQNATGLQVTIGVLAAIVWAIENPRMGIIEADDMDFERMMEIIEPYMGKMVGEYTDWTPLTGRQKLFPESVDKKDPWQFKNFRVV